MTLIANERAVSDNITARAVYERIVAGNQPLLRASLELGRVELIAEDVRTPSFKPRLLSPRAKAAVARAEICFCKGVALCETFQLIAADAYFGFVASSPFSVRIAGMPRGSPVVLHAGPGRVLWERPDL